MFTDAPDDDPPGLGLPGHERLRKMGVTFHNHYCPAVMCTSSRSVLLTGLQTADTGMFDNTNVPWQPIPSASQDEQQQQLWNCTSSSDHGTGT